MSITLVVPRFMSLQNLPSHVTHSSAISGLLSFLIGHASSLLVSPLYKYHSILTLISLSHKTRTTFFQLLQPDCIIWLISWSSAQSDAVWEPIYSKALNAFQLDIWTSLPSSFSYRIIYFVFILLILILHLSSPFIQLLLNSFSGGVYQKYIVRIWNIPWS